MHPQAHVTGPDHRFGAVLEGHDLLRFTELVDPQCLHDARVSQTSRFTGLVELTATRMVAGGDALGRADDGRVALIDGALPGERVRIEVTADKADLLRGRVVEVLEASPARVRLRPRPRGLRRLRVATRRDRDAAAAQARHHPRRAAPASPASPNRRSRNRSCCRPRDSARRCARSSSTASPRSGVTSRTIRC